MNKEWNSALTGLEEWEVANVKQIRPMPQRRTLVIHVNSFTGKIAGGYIAQNGRKITGYLNNKEIGELVSNDDICVEFLKV